MLNVTKELTALARKLGYTGKAPDTVAKAINAITSVAGEGGGSGCDCEPGYEVVETQLFSETVTTADDGNGSNVADLSYSQQITADTIIVTFDGTEYECPRINTDGGSAYGGFNNAPDFTEYPFFIWSSSNPQANKLATQTAGEHTIVVSASVIQTSADFTAAVAAVSPTELFVATEYITTWQEVHDAVAAKKLAFVCKKIDDNLFCEPVLFMSGSEYKLTTMKSDGAQFETITYTADTADGPIYAK